MAGVVPKHRGEERLLPNDARSVTSVPMPHDVSLISTIAVGFGLALVFGFAAARLRMPPLVGYLLAGIVIGPGTPGFVADMALARAHTRDYLRALRAHMRHVPDRLVEQPVEVLPDVRHGASRGCKWG